MSDFPCSLTRNMTSHSMKNLAFHRLLRWKMIILSILTTSLTVQYTFLFKKAGRMYVLNLGVEGLILSPYNSPWACFSALQCLSKETLSSMNGSKSCRWLLINSTVSFLWRTWVVWSPSSWSPRARNRQFLLASKHRNHDQMVSTCD